jgi:hypothetical protein
VGNNGCDALQSRIWNIIEIHKDAEDLTNAEVIGVLELIKLDLHHEILEDSKEQ